MSDNLPVSQNPAAINPDIPIETLENIWNLSPSPVLGFQNLGFQNFWPYGLSPSVGSQLSNPPPSPPSPQLRGYKSSAAVMDRSPKEYPGMATFVRDMLKLAKYDEPTPSNSAGGSAKGNSSSKKTNKKSRDTLPQLTSPNLRNVPQADVSYLGRKLWGTASSRSTPNPHSVSPNLTYTDKLIRRIPLRNDPLDRFPIQEFCPSRTGMRFTTSEVLGILWFSTTTILSLPVIANIVNRLYKRDDITQYDINRILNAAQHHAVEYRPWFAGPRKVLPPVNEDARACYYGIPCSEAKRTADNDEESYLKIARGIWDFSKESEHTCITTTSVTRKSFLGRLWNTIVSLLYYLLMAFLVWMCIVLAMAIVNDLYSQYSKGVAKDVGGSNGTRYDGPPGPGQVTSVGRTRVVTVLQVNTQTQLVGQGL